MRSWPRSRQDEAGDQPAPTASLDKVVKRYGPLEAVRAVDLALYPGEVVGLLGPNGAGKSTMLGLLAGLIVPTSGMVRVLGRAPRQARHVMACLPEGLHGWMTPRLLLRLMHGLYPNFSAPRYAELLDFLEVPEKPAAAMSRGQQARLRLAVTMAVQAQLYLLDEPLANIDLLARETILEALFRHRHDQACYLLATHEIAEAGSYLDRVVMIHGGQVIGDQRVAELKRQGLDVEAAYRQAMGERLAAPGLPRPGP